MKKYLLGLVLMALTLTGFATAAQGTKYKTVYSACFRVDHRTGQTFGDVSTKVGRPLYCIVGRKGKAGAKGTRGVTGSQGLTGSQGVQGVPGLPGKDGKDGAAGVGINLVIHAQEECNYGGWRFIFSRPDLISDKSVCNGAPGQAGAPGPAGPAGADGSAGADGATGPAGPRGYTGAKGDPGPAGPQGPKGDPGTNGLGNGTGWLCVSNGTNVKFGGFGVQPDCGDNGHSLTVKIVIVQ